MCVRHYTEKYEKTIFILCIIATALLSACDREDVAHEATDVMSSSEVMLVSEPTEETVIGSELDDIPEKAFDLSNLSPMEAFRKVLLSEAPFVCNVSDVEMSEYRGYLNEMPHGNSSMVTPQFTILDMDGDEIPEIVLAIDNYLGSIVLRYHKGIVLGNEIGYRSMYLLKENGSFWQSSGAGEYSISKLYFVDNTVCFDDILDAYEGMDYAYYYSHDVPVDKNHKEKLINTFDEMNEIEWYDFREKEICKQVVDDTILPEADLSTNERQDYLDSLYYLIDSNKTIIWKRYYYNCIEEMNAIYELCKDKFSGEALEDLEADQQYWQEAIDRRLVEDLYRNGQAYSIEEARNKHGLYRTYGGFYLRRTFHLVNFYYDCYFYE